MFLVSDDDLKEMILLFDQSCKAFVVPKRRRCNGSVDMSLRLCGLLIDNDLVLCEGIDREGVNFILEVQSDALLPWVYIAFFLPRPV